MAKKSPIAPNTQEHREDAPPAWPEVQDGLATNSGLALLLVDGHQPPALVVSNNNSICQAFQTSPDHVKLCDPYCGVAHAEAIKAGGTVEYKCHAGLNCFAKPVEIGGKRKLAVIGGRAFTKSADYRQLMERFRSGDLQSLASDDVFANVIFGEAQRLGELAERVERTTDRFHVASSNGSARNGKPKSEAVAAPPPAPVTVSTKPDLEQEVRRLRGELEYRSRLYNSLQHFLKRISDDDPVKTYNSIVSNSKELLQSERASLLVLNEQSNALILKAASGLATELAMVGPIRVGEGVSGHVIDSGQAIVTKDLRLEGHKPAPPERRYKTNSFISYPITIGGRKVGVLNITDKAGGRTFDELDLGL